MLMKSMTTTLLGKNNTIFIFLKKIWKICLSQKSIEQNNVLFVFPIFRIQNQITSKKIQPLFWLSNHQKHIK
jgi:hypothetical protein